MIMYLIVAILIIPPFVITIINIIFALGKPAVMYTKKKEYVSEFLTFFLGIPLSFFFIEMKEIIFAADWNETLSNSRLHTPIWSGGMAVVFLFAAIGILSYIVMRSVPIKRMSPLIAVVSITGLYMGILMAVLWILQLSNKPFILVFLGLLPLNCIVLAIKAIRHKIYQWNQLGEIKLREYRSPLLNKMNQKLQRSERWPFYAFILMLPVLLICMLVLMLFGQQPDSIIKAWTETSDWALSAQKAPPNIQFDQHYLCTVAAGGHDKIVKPKRMGIRHGHQVVVNRQLCVANAFEQLLSERAPKFHKAVRTVYDRYGFPVAKLIRSRYAADLIYILMKPLEWIFLLVLYLFDANPENRIAMQYIAPIPEDFH